MRKVKIFISSVQSEFAKERQMYLTAFIERLGTGTTDMVEKAKEAGLPEPEFIQNDMFRTVIYRKQTVEKTVEKILAAIKENPHITQNQMAEKTGLSRRGIEWNLKKLKEQGLIKRVGADRGGYWKIVNGK